MLHIAYLQSIVRYIECIQALFIEYEVSFSIPLLDYKK